MKVLVVEDEAIVRRGIVSKIGRLVKECEVVGEAKSGEEAFKMICELMPDIVITDIKMSGMSGLLLIEKAKEINPTIKFIIISGYDDFEYARNAIRLGVFEYMLKPVGNKNLQMALEKLCEKIKKEKEELKKVAGFRRQFKTDHAGRKNYALSGYFTGRSVSKKQIIEQVCEKDEHLERRYFTAIKIAYKKAANDALTEELTEFILVNVLEEMFAKISFCLGFFQAGTGEGICAFLNHDVEPYRIEKQVMIYIDKMKEIMEGDICAAIGRSYETFEGFETSFREAEIILKQKIVLDTQPILLWSDYLSIYENDYSLGEDDRRLISRHLMFLISERDALNELIAGIFHSIYQKKVCYANIKTVYFDIIILILKEIKGLNNGQYREEFDIDVETLMKSNAAITDLITQCTGLIDSIYNRIKEEGMEGGKKIVLEIQKRMKEEYFLDLKLSSFAEEYYINQSYLSTLFLQETGQNFTKYLTEIRIQKAKELLESTKFSTMRVAEFVGYNDRGYFTGVFQKKVGLSPAEYRKSVIAGKEEKNEGHE